MYLSLPSYQSVLNVPGAKYRMILCDFSFASLPKLPPLFLSGIVGRMMVAGAARDVGIERLSFLGLFGFRLKYDLVLEIIRY
jgi:hypothetical protein